MSREQQLTQVLVDFAHVLGTDFSIQGILDHLVYRIKDVMNVDGAGVMLMGDDGGLHFIASTNEVIRRIEVLQNELNEGPCLEAWRSGEAVSIPDLRSDTSFPHFSARARNEDMGAVFTFPLRLDEHRLGALDLYRGLPGRLTASDRRAGQVLADVAAAYVFNAQARHTARDGGVSLEQAPLPLHDSLTGLPNGALVADLIDRAVHRSRGSQRVVAVVLVDLKGLPAINARFGRFTGDQVVKAVPRRLRRVVRSGDVIARMSEAHFAVLCEGLSNSLEAEKVSRRIADALSSPFPIGDEFLDVTASIGLAHSAGRGSVSGALLRAAAVAEMQAQLNAGGQESEDRPPEPRPRSRLRSVSTR